MLFALEYLIDLLQCLAFGLNPVDSLAMLAEVRTKLVPHTISTMIIMSHPPLTMYIFQPMLLSPIGMINTRRHL